MPLSDGYESDKRLTQDAVAAAEGVTEHLKSVGRDDRIGFIVFLYDSEESILQYISDMPREDVMKMLKHWVDREIQ